MSKTAVDWSAVRQEIKAQMPKLHVPETVAGSVAGAGIGSLAQILRGWLQTREDRKTHGKPSVLSGALSGALVGGFGANLLSDRLRRYVSNMPNPYDYNYRRQMQDVSDAGLAGFIRGAVLDRPLTSVPSASGVGGSGIERTMRRELLRRGLGVHTDNPTSDWFKQVGGAKDGAPLLHLADRLFGPDNRMRADMLPAWKEIAPPGSVLDWMEEPDRYGKPAVVESNLFRHFSMTPYGKTMRMRDKWDFDLHPDEQKKLHVLAGKWRSPSGVTRQEKSEALSLLARLVADKTFASRMPVFDQSLAIQGSGSKPEWANGPDAPQYDNSENWNASTMPFRLAP